MKKLLLSTIIITVLTISFLTYKKLDSESFFMSKEEKYFYQKLKEFKESGKESIPLKELTNFEWNEVCVVMTYGAVEENSYADFYLGNKNQLKLIPNQKYFNEKIEGKVFNQKEIRGRSYISFAGYSDLKENLETHRIKTSNCKNNGIESSFDNRIKINVTEDQNSYDHYKNETKFYDINFFYENYHQ